MKTIEEIKEITDKEFQTNKINAMTSIQKGIELAATKGKYSLTIEEEIFSDFKLDIIKHFINLGYKVKLTGNIAFSALTIKWDDSRCTHSNLIKLSSGISKCKDCETLLIENN